MAAKSKIKREMQRVKEDFKWLGVTQESIAKELNTTRVKLNKMYTAKAIDIELAARMKQLRDSKMKEAENKIAA